MRRSQGDVGQRRVHKLKARFDVRAVGDDDGTFAGWASTFNTVDSYETAMAPGCFARSIAEHKAGGGMPALLWQHYWDEIPGRILSLEERDEGLWLEGQLELETVRGREAHALLKPKPHPALNGLSIGFTAPAGGYEFRNGVLYFTDVDLWEVSLVTFPANEEARVETVRAAGDVNTIRDLERALRDSGHYSRAEAKLVVSNFIAKNTTPTQRDAEPNVDHLKQVLAAFAR